MNRCHRNVVIGAAGLGLLVTDAHAHYMTTPYVLPVPFWMYVYGCAATLVLTFAVLGYFVNAKATGATFGGRAVTLGGHWPSAGRWTIRVLQAGALACLLLTIVAGLMGTLDSTRNINMKLFWVVFLLGLAYLTALVGDIFAFANPWRTVASWIDAISGGAKRRHFRYPASLGYYPAVLFYIVLIWIELFVPPNPHLLGETLLIYSVVTLGGAILFGANDWFHFAEFFGVFFRQIGTLAPIEYVPSEHRTTWQVRVRMPFVGAAAERPEHLGLVLFILFMLASTSYDAIHDTETWITFYWKFLIVLAQPLWGTDMSKSQDMLMAWYLIYLRVGLVISPFVYLAVYFIVIWWMKKITRSALAVKQLALDFAPSLIPIAVVYNVCHYYTMLLSEGAMLPVVSSDPLGFGWNLFGLELPVPSYLEMGTVWHTQVGLILGGHLISVYLGHVIALRVFHSRRQVVLSQVPLLTLMVAYTAIGLYILSLPLAMSVLRD